MNKILVILKYIAYLNIPLMIGALYIIYLPLLTGYSSETIDNTPKALILVGFALSFTSLRDVKKIDKLGRFVIERPIVFRTVLYSAIFLSLIMLLYGVYLVITTADDNQLGIGLMSFGIGFIALAKSLVDQAKDLTDHYD